MITLTDQEYREALVNKQAFEAVLNKAATATIEASLKMLPRVTASLIKTSVAVQSMAEDFKTRNPHLAGKEELIQKTVMQVEKEMPAADYEAILKEAEDRLKFAQAQLPLNLRDITRKE